MFDGRWRTTFEKGLQPVGVHVRQIGIKADHVTVAGLVAAGATALTIANGFLRAGLVLVIVTAVLDLIDGAVAKAAGTTSPRGAFLDSVADRVSDALLMGGVAWYLATTQSGRVAVLPLALVAASMLVSYERAKAESLGFEARGGLMERAERLVVLAFGLLFDSLLVPVLWVMLILTLITAAQRFVRVWHQASAPPTPRPLRVRWGSRRVPRSTRRVWRRRGIGPRQHRL
jgi:CDP-diacylglycerol---glycerol-3-phosphate 3-phosphatidyltransferase